MWTKKILALIAFIALMCGALFVLRIQKRKSEAKRLADRASVTRTHAEQGDVKAERLLGSLYYYGSGVPQDYVQAAQWYRKAADQGDADAESNLSFMYYEGKGLPLDYTTAALWCRKAADQGLARAQTGMGNMYYHGQGVPQDYGEALRWYRKAADQNNPTSESAIGYMYHNGLGVSKDNYEAMRWYRKAAAHGDAESRRFIASYDASRRRYLIWRYIDLFALLAGGCLFTFNFLLPGKSIRNRKQVILTIAGVLTLSYTVLSFYGAAHNEMRDSALFNALWWTKRLLMGTSVVMLLVILLTPKKKSINAEM